MSSSVNCPQGKKKIPMGECLGCKYNRQDQDVSVVWCRYTIGKKIDTPGEIRELNLKLQRKEEQMARAYKMGKTRVGDNLMLEGEKLRREIKKLKEDQDEH